MNSLREVQLGLCDAIWKGGEGFDHRIRSNGLTSQQRLQIYRNNVISGQVGALKTTYPVIARLVGDEFFGYLARQYLKDNRSQTGNLNDLGHNFDSFLTTFPGTDELVYLPDVAKLEWAIHRILLATVRSPMGLDPLSKISDTRYGELGFVIQPASCLVSSVYPVLQIWQVNQEDFHGDVAVNLSGGGVELLVIRRGLEIEFESLTAGEYCLLKALSEKQPFSKACEFPLKAQPDLDLVSCLQRYVASGVIVDFFFTDTEVIHD